MGTERQETTYRFFVHFDDGGSGMRSRTEPLRPGDALFDGRRRLRRRAGRARTESDELRPRLGETD
jgi:hypothetical protein